MLVRETIEDVVLARSLDAGMPKEILHKVGGLFQVQDESRSGTLPEKMTANIVPAKVFLSGFVQLDVEIRGGVLLSPWGLEQEGFAFEFLDDSLIEWGRNSFEILPLVFVLAYPDDCHSAFYLHISWTNGKGFLNSCPA